MASNYVGGFTLPIGTTVASGGQAQALSVFAAGVRTDEVQVGPTGLPLYRLGALVFFAGQAPLDAELRFEASNKPPDLPGGMVTLPAGTTVTVMGPRKGGYGLTLHLCVPADKVMALFGSGTVGTSNQPKLA